MNEVNNTNSLMEQMLIEDLKYEESLKEKEKLISYTPKPGNKIIYRYSSEMGDYIGQTKYSIKKRAGKNGAGYIDNEFDTKWSKAIKQYGIDSFDIEILEEVPIEKADERERYYIAKYNTWQAGFNSTPGGKAYKCGTGDIKRTFIDLREIYGNCDLETLQALLGIFQILAEKPLDQLQDPMSELPKLAKLLNEHIVGYDYYAMEGEYFTYWASMLMFCYNFDIEKDAKKIFSSFSKKVDNEPCEGRLAMYMMWDTCTDFWIYEECLGGDVVTGDDIERYVFVWGEEKL